MNREDSGELERNRHFAFLRRLIGEQILERFGGMVPKGGESTMDELARSLAPHLGMTPKEVQNHLEPHIREGQIVQMPAGGGPLRWDWADS